MWQSPTTKNKAAASMKSTTGNAAMQPQRPPALSGL
jgi:hypothetical protein